MEEVEEDYSVNESSKVDEESQTDITYTLKAPPRRKVMFGL